MSDDTSVDRLPDRKQVMALIGAHNANKAKHAKDNKAVADLFAVAAENGNVHVKAAKFVASLVRMEELQRNDFLRHLDAYREWAEAELFSKNEHIGDLAEQANQRAAAEKAAKDEKHAADNAKRLKKGIKKLEEPGGDEGGEGGSDEGKQAAAGDGLTDEEREFDGETSSKPPRTGMPGAEGAPVH